MTGWKSSVDPPPKVEERRGFEVSYHGVPRAGLRIGKNSHGERTFFSENWPDKARHWLPTLDHPSDKATSEFLITAPARYQVVANGLLQEERDLGDGRRLTHWKQSVPIATWLNAVGVAQFAAHHAGSRQGRAAGKLGLSPGSRSDHPGTRNTSAGGSSSFIRNMSGPIPTKSSRACRPRASVAASSTPA